MIQPCPYMYVKYKSIFEGSHTYSQAVERYSAMFARDGCILKL